MILSSDIIRGHSDAIILSILKNEDSYAYLIGKKIKEKSGFLFELKEPTLYSALKRLEKDGFITSYPGNESEGSKRKYYSITIYGKMYLQKSVDDWFCSKKIIDKFMNN